MEKQDFLDLIQSNIDEHGFHITVVYGTIEPRFAYTIGLTDLLGFELIFAGGSYFMRDDLSVIFHDIVKLIKKENNVDGKFEVPDLGTFLLSAVNPTWSKLMMLGAIQRYQTEVIKAFQIIPDLNHYTLDVPDMSGVFNAALQPIWQWLVNKWDLPVPKKCTVITNLDALFGKPITELTRWENDEWEMFAGAGPDVDENDTRVVSLATILGIDKTLMPSVNLEIGEGLWREDGKSDWNNWV